MFVIFYSTVLYFKQERLVLSVFLFIITIIAQANNNVQITPTSVLLSSSATNQVINLSNTGDSPVSYQLTSFKSWKQIKSKNTYQESKEIVAMPPIMTILPGHQQIVRLGYIGPWDFKKEKAYRILFHQIIDKQLKAKNHNGLAINLAIDFSVPIYVKPTGPISFEVTGRAHLNKNQLTIHLENRGTEHIKIVKANVVTANGQSLWTDGWLMNALAGGGETLSKSIHLKTHNIPEYVLLVSDDKNKTSIKLPITTH